MKQEILDILQQTLGLPSGFTAEVTVGDNRLYADVFAARLAEELTARGYTRSEKEGCICGCEADDDTDRPIACNRCARQPCICPFRGG